MSRIFKSPLHLLLPSSQKDWETEQTQLGVSLWLGSVLGGRSSGSTSICPRGPLGSINRGRWMNAGSWRRSQGPRLLICCFPQRCPAGSPHPDRCSCFHTPRTSFLAPPQRLQQWAGRAHSQRPEFQLPGFLGPCICPLLLQPWGLRVAPGRYFHASV